MRRFKVYNADSKISFTLLENKVTATQYKGRENRTILVHWLFLVISSRIIQVNIVTEGASCVMIMVEPSSNTRWGLLFFTLFWYPWDRRESVTSIHKMVTSIDFIDLKDISTRLYLFYIDRLGSSLYIIFLVVIF